MQAAVVADDRSLYNLLLELLGRIAQIGDGVHRLDVQQGGYLPETIIKINDGDPPIRQVCELSGEIGGEHRRPYTARCAHHGNQRSRLAGLYALLRDLANCIGKRLVFDGLGKKLLYLFFLEVL